MANIGSLTARIERLEAAAGIRGEGIVVLIHKFTGGDLRGISGTGTYWKRNAGESEEALRQRARSRS